MRRCFVWPHWAVVYVLLLVLTSCGNESGKKAPQAPEADAIAEHTVSTLQGDRALAARLDAMFAASAESEEASRTLSLFPEAPEPCRLLHVEFVTEAKAEAFELPNSSTITSLGRFRDILIPASDLKEAKAVLTKENGVVWHDEGAVLPLPPPPVDVPTKGVLKAPADRIVQGGIRVGGKHLKGRGVIIAIVDTGLDFKHPDFVSYDDEGTPTSRVKYLWDVTQSVNMTPELEQRGVHPGPIRYPSGEALGTVYTQEALTAAIRGELELPDTEQGHHGTSCAGIAAGNGNTWRKWRSKAQEVPEGAPGREARIGVAPEADIIAVRVDSGDADGLEYTGLLGAICGWLFEIAEREERPLVVSCSFGGSFGGRDGSFVLERQLDLRFAPDVRGRTICIAAGNEGFKRLHARVSIGPKDDPTTVRWVVSKHPGAANPSPPLLGALELIAHTDEHPPLTFRGKARWMGPGVLHELAGDSRYEIRILEPGSYGKLEIWHHGEGRIDADLWIHGQGRGTWLEFDKDTGSYDMMVDTPGTMTHAVTVGSFDWNNEFLCGSQKRFARIAGIGALSSYSSPGPRRDGVTKPDIVAPGQWYSAPVAREVAERIDAGTCEGMRPPFLDASRGYCLMNGTSAATPYTAGIVALMFEYDPSLTSGQVRKLLRDHADDSMIDGGNKPYWGGGKLTYEAVKSVFEALEAR